MDMYVLHSVKRSENSASDVENNPLVKKTFDAMVNGGVNPKPILLPINEDKKGEVNVKTEVAAKDMANSSPDVNDKLSNSDLRTVSKSNMDFVYHTRECLYAGSSSIGLSIVLKQ